MTPLEHKYNLTVICPGIRTHNWERLYQSMIESCGDYTWELIFVGPKNTDSSTVLADERVSFIEDWGTPIRCQQIGLIHAQGEYINWAADDGYFLPNILNTGLNIAYENPGHIVMQKYYEGAVNSVMENEDYYKINYHDATRSNFVPDSYFGLNVGCVPRKILLELGGWDCLFEVCPMAYADFACRAQRAGVKFVIQDEMAFKCGHMPGRSGDHAPIHDAQLINDEPMFKHIYNDPESKNRVTIPLNNWQKIAPRWARRFG